MLRMVICCGGGFSSSALAIKMQKEVVRLNLSEQVAISFIPFHDFKVNTKDYDIALLCPHLLQNAKKFVEDTNFIDYPLYIIPPRLYGLMSFEALYEDALDLIENFKLNPKNIACFENEENALKIQRCVSYAKAQPKKQPL